MVFDISAFHQVFFDEAQEHLDEMERLLLTIDPDSPSYDELNAIFRAAHSIKGGAGTFGFQNMTDFTHVLESLLDKVRKQELSLTPEIVDASLRAGDVLRNQLAGCRDGVDVDLSLEETVKQALMNLALGAGRGCEEIKSPSEVHHREPCETGRLILTIREGMGNLTAEEVDAVLNELKQSAGRVSRLDESPLGIRFVVEDWFFPQATLELKVHDALGFLLPKDGYVLEWGGAGNVASTIKTESVSDTVENFDGYGFFTPLPNEISQEHTEISVADRSCPLQEGDGFGFFVSPESIRQQTQEDTDNTKGYGFFKDPEQLRAEIENEQGYGFFIDPAPLVRAQVRSESSSDRSSQPSVGAVRKTDREAESSIRVSVEKVDQMINLVGELVITHAMLAETATTFDPVLHEKLFSGLKLLERNSRDLQDAVMSIRMLPISFVFSRFPRVVRDLAGKLGKQVELKTLGEGTELDKGLIEKIADPLTHLVRNSLDHGIEMPDVREAAGKSAKGTLLLEAFHQGGNIVIRVSDDGAGLNREKILAKARERGIPVSDDMSDSDVWQLIFAPGFSTADVVTDVSGRGVGMDVVRRNIEGMGGRVEISSEQGHGTCIGIRLPLTLAILDGMSVGVGDQIYILPLGLIVESFQPKPEELSTISGKGRVVHVRGEYLPLVALHEVFNIPSFQPDPCQGIVVILEFESGKVGLFVDQLLGEHQVVIKSLETNYRKVKGLSGATIMGDGRVAMILDVASMIALSRASAIAAN